MAHYICEGTCKGVSQAPKACDTATCTNYKMMLQPCDCTDGLHYERQTVVEKPDEPMAHDGYGDEPEKKM